MLLVHGFLSQSLAKLAVDSMEVIPIVTIRLAYFAPPRRQVFMPPLTFYRFVRESLLNAIHYGHASRIEITMCCNNVQPLQIVRPLPMTGVVFRTLLRSKTMVLSESGTAPARLEPHICHPLRVEDWTITELRTLCR